MVIDILACTVVLLTIVTAIVDAQAVGRGGAVTVICTVLVSVNLNWLVTSNLTE